MKEDAPRVLVLLAAHNGCEWVDEQVETILQQQRVSVQLLISVDASSDGTEAWVDDKVRLNPRIVTLPHGERFGSAAANFFRLIREANTEDCDYVALADQDDIWFEDKLDRATRVMTAAGADAYSSNVIAVWPDGRKQAINKAQPQRQYDFLFEAAGPGCTYVFTRNCFQRLQQFVLHNEEQVRQVSLHDWFCYAFVRSQGLVWHIDSEAKMLYRQHAKNHLGVNSGMVALRSRLRLVSGGWWLAQARLMATAMGLEHASHVRPWITPVTRSGYLYLAFNTHRFRRRGRDRIAMACLCCWLWIAGKRPS